MGREARSVARVTGRSYLRAARTSFRWNRQDIVPSREVDCRRDIVPFRSLLCARLSEESFGVRGGAATRRGPPSVGG